MKGKLSRFILWAVITFASIACSIYVKANQWILTLAAMFGGLALPKAFDAAVDFLDDNMWKMTERKLKRGGFIDRNTLIRISFAYLYRIKVDGKYLLVKNARGTGKYQPVGGVYKTTDAEASKLKNLYNVVDDDKIPMDSSTRRDYRMQLPDRYLRRFVRRFNRASIQRENIENLSREFREELIDTGILNWSKIRYRFCGRHYAELKYSNHFQCYELLLADIVELIPSTRQKTDLQKLMQQSNDYLFFATADEIKALGVQFGTDRLQETIGDHSVKILQETEQHLERIRGYGEKYKVSL